MSAEELTLEDVTRYLEGTSWKKYSAGNSGFLWEKTDSNGEKTKLAVPSISPPDSILWSSVIESISKFENLSFARAKFRIKHPDVDVTRVRAANDVIISETIPFSEGVGLIGSAYKMLRASATTSRGAKGHIGSNYSKTGDEIIAQARLGQTEIGSYVLPILMPLTPIVPTKKNEDQYELSNLERVAEEPIERRVVRTFAEALQSLNSIVIEPGTDPKARSMPHLIASGVSREMVVAITEILQGGSAPTFDAAFEWAPFFGKPAGVPEQISIPAGAEELLIRTARLLKSSRQEPEGDFTGPLVAVAHKPGEELGTVGIQATRGGRLSEIRVILRQDQIQNALEWMHSSRTVIISGKLVKEPGKPLRIDRATKFRPLDEDFLIQT